MTVIGLVLIGIAVALILLSSPLMDLARKRIESAIATHYGTTASIDALRLAPLDGGIELVGIKLYNPEPFPREPAIECGRILLCADPATIFSSAPTFADVVIEEPKVNLRYDLGKGTNLGALLRHSDTAQAASTDAEQAKQRKFFLQDYFARDAQVTVTSNAILDTSLPFEVPAFRVKEVATEQAVSAFEASRIFIRSLLLEAVGLNGLLEPVAEMLGTELAHVSPAE
jgi:hypothetical protein